MTRTLLKVTRVGKCVITHGNGTFGNVAAMDDTSWSTCEELWERLRWARLNSSAQMDTKAAASAIGVSVETYRAYERAPGASKSLNIAPQNIIALARRWKVSWQWIVSGEGTPFDKALSSAQVRVVSALDRASPEEQERVVSAIEMLLTGTK